MSAKKGMCLVNFMLDQLILIRFLIDIVDKIYYNLILLIFGLLKEYRYDYFCEIK
jgi:hypothetical protein